MLCYKRENIRIQKDHNDSNTFSIENFNDKELTVLRMCSIYNGKM